MYRWRFQICDGKYMRATTQFCGLPAEAPRQSGFFGDETEMFGRAWAGIDVFLSFWPANSKVAAGLRDQLARIFGVHHVRYAAHDEEVSWPLTQIERVFPASAVMVVLIGRDWAHLINERGNRLDDSANSHLRDELLQAFRLNLLIVPVCIDGAAMPDRDQLPGFLRPLAGFSPTRLRTDDLDADKRIFKRDARTIAGAIEAEWRRRQGIAPRWAIGLALAAALIAAAAAGAGGAVLLDSLGLPLLSGGRLRAVKDEPQALWQRLDAAEKGRDDARREAATLQGRIDRLAAAGKGQDEAGQSVALRDRLAKQAQQLAAAEQERDASRNDVAIPRREIDGLRQHGLKREVVLTIDNVPSHYDEKAVLRLVLSALRGGMLTDIVGIRHEPATAGRTRVVVLTVDSTAVDLKVADQRVDCQAANCMLNVALRPWYVDSRAGDREEPRFIAGTRLRGERVDAFLGRLGVKDVYLPRITQSGHALVYLPNDSYFQIFLRGASGERAPFVDIRGGDYNLLRLEGAAQRWSIRPDYDPSLPVVGDR
jgi:hypothetical protein